MPFRRKHNPTFSQITSIFYLIRKLFVKKSELLTFGLQKRVVFALLVGGVFPQVLVNFLRRLSAGPHCQNDGGRSGHRIPSGKNARQGGAAAALLGGQPPAPVSRQTGRCPVQQGVRRRPDGHDDRVAVQGKLCPRHHLGAAAAAFIRLAQGHGVAPYPGHKAVLIPQDLHWVGQQPEGDALLLGVLHFLGPGRQLLPAPPVHDGHLGAAAQGASGGIHGHIAAAHNHHMLGGHEGGGSPRFGGVHQVDAGQPFIGGKNAAQRFSRDAHEVGQAGPAAQEYGRKTVLQQLLHRYRPAYDGVGLDGDAQFFQPGDLLMQDVLWQAEGWDAVGQHPAGGVQRLKNGDGIAHPGQLPRTGQAGRPGADHGDLFALFFGAGWSLRFLLGPVPIGHKAFQPADGDAFALLAPDTDGLALVFLGADPAADGGQGIIRREDFPGGGKITFGDLGDKLRDMDAHRAAAAAGCAGAAEAAAGFFHGGYFIIA